MYKVLVEKKAFKELKKLDKTVVRRVMTAIQKLSSDPRPPGSKKLSGSENTWRIRVGDYRVLYAIDDVIRLIEITKVGHRRDVYRD